MDPLAHTLVGGSLAETGLRKATPLATATLVLGANIPDVDIAAGLLGRDASLYLRRGHTHGVLAMVLLPVVLTGALMAYDRLWRRRRRPEAAPTRFAPLLGLALLATLTHPVLDWMNTYGVRLLMPFSDRWFYGDALFIIDPWMWLLMGAAVVLARSSRRPSIAAWIVLGAATSALVVVTDFPPWPAKVVWLVGVGAIVAARVRGTSERAVRRTAGVSLAVLGVYLGAMVYGSELARDRAASWLRERGHAPGEVMAGPIPAHPFARDVIAVTPDGYRFLRIDWLAEPRVRETHEPLAGNERSEVVRAALDAPSVRGMRTWMRFPSYEVERLEDGWRVTIEDVRYSRRDAPIGTAVVELGPDLEPRR